MYKVYNFFKYTQYLPGTHIGEHLATLKDGVNKVGNWITVLGPKLASIRLIMVAVYISLV